MDPSYYEDGDSDIDYSNQQSFYENPTAELEFQTFDPSETENVPQPDFGDIELEDISGDNAPGDETPARAPGEGKPWEISYYQQFFDIDTLDIGKRIGSSVFPLKDFFQLLGGNPDLYGWFWIASTLIFVVAAAGNFAAYVTCALNDQLDEWTFDFAKLGFGALTIYLYITACPLLVYVAMNLWLQLKPTLMEHFCIYGYSIFPYIPAAIVMIIPLELVRWAIMGLACLLVCAFLVRNYYFVIQDKKMEGACVLLVMVIANIFLALVLQFYFFEFTGCSRSATNSDDSSSFASSNTSNTSHTSNTSNTSHGSPSSEESSFSSVEEEISSSPSPSPSVSAVLPSVSFSSSISSSTSMIPLVSVTSSASVVPATPSASISLTTSVSLTTSALPASPSPSPSLTTAISVSAGDIPLIGN